MFGVTSQIFPLRIQIVDICPAFAGQPLVASPIGDDGCSVAHLLADLGQGVSLAQPEGRVGVPHAVRSLMAEAGFGDRPVQDPMDEVAVIQKAVLLADEHPGRHLSPALFSAFQI